jgi:hypothetical protein
MVHYYEPTTRPYPKLDEFNPHWQGRTRQTSVTPPIFGKNQYYENK